MLVHKKFPLVLGLCAAFVLTACNGNNGGVAEAEAQSHNQHAQHEQGAQQEQQMVHMDVYKSETCGCCKGWMDHVENHNFHLSAHHPEDLAAEKARLGIAPALQSCHTAVTEEGYVFEGHIPAKVISRFLAEKPADALGLAVPGMPLGSPGMEMDNRFTPYQVLLVKKDGSTEVFASMETAADQF